MNANEANRIATEVHEADHNIEISTVYELIRQEAEYGKFELVYTGLMTSVKETLIENGYAVNTEDDVAFISWKSPEE